MFFQAGSAGLAFIVFISPLRQGELLGMVMFPFVVAAAVLDATRRDREWGSTPGSGVREGQTLASPSRAGAGAAVSTGVGSQWRQRQPGQGSPVAPAGRR